MTEKKEIKAYKRKMGDLLFCIACLNAGHDASFEAVTCCLDDLYDDIYDKYCDQYEAKYGEQPPCEQARVAYNQAVGRRKAAEAGDPVEIHIHTAGKDNGWNDDRVKFYQSNICQLVERLGCLKSGFDDERVESADDYIKVLSKEYGDLHTEYEKLRDGAEPSTV